MRALLLALTVPLAAPAAAQQLRVRELSGGGVAALAQRDFVGAGLTFGWRPGGQTRFALALAPGWVDGRRAVRGEAAVQLLLTPAARRGAGIYAGAGLTWQGADRDAGGTGYLLVLVGVESAPGRRWGWYAEAGFAGGVRLGLGVRRRWFPAWW